MTRSQSNSRGTAQRLPVTEETDRQQQRQHSLSSRQERHALRLASRRSSPRSSSARRRRSDCSSAKRERSHASGCQSKSAFSPRSGAGPVSALALSCGCVSVLRPLLTAVWFGGADPPAPVAVGKVLWFAQHRRCALRHLLGRTEGRHPPRTPPRRGRARERERQQTRSVECTCRCAAQSEGALTAAHASNSLCRCSRRRSTGTYVRTRPPPLLDCLLLTVTNDARAAKGGSRELIEYLVGAGASVRSLDEVRRS